MELRPLGPNDYDAVYALWKRIPGMGLRSLDDSREGIARFLLRNPSLSFLFAERERLAGCILSGHDGRRGSIYHLCVDPAFRGRGLGRQLVQSALDALHAEGILKVALVCFKNNEPGNGFWAAMGFERREDLNYYGLSLNKENR
ncbi:MAG: GNAT family N-acetyltransferase [Christensenellaceae bacterium]|jgi:ribosomal protein S18 acetylase RimI-like enzyme|nr:GNAT family N-acetyltransferase [Christensenellaceae bacterium]